MNNKQTKIVWMNKASERIDLRYPKVDLGVTPPFGERKEGIITLNTFVSNKAKDRLILVVQKYHYTSEQNVFESIEQFKKRFDEQCLLYKEKFIFNIETSISEPFEILKK